MKTDGAGNYSVITDDSSDWNEAHGWGNHASGGYQSALTFGIANTNTVKLKEAINELRGKSNPR